MGKLKKALAKDPVLPEAIRNDCGKEAKTNEEALLNKHFPAIKSKPDAMVNFLAQKQVKPKHRDWN